MRLRWEEIGKEYLWLETKYFDFDSDKKGVKKYNEMFRLTGEVAKEELAKIITENKNK